MKILYILKRDPDETLQIIMEVHKRTSEVNVVDIREGSSYSRLVEMIEQSDKIISW
jgi:hypothetical protein